MIQFLLLLLLVMLVLGLAILAVIYLPLMPLFLQTWFVELFGDVDASSGLPVLTVSLFVLVVGYQHEWDWRRLRDGIRMSRAKTMVPGLLLLVLGATVFGQAWEVMELQRSYLAAQRTFFNSSPCADYVTACLIEDEARRPEQVFKAWFAAILWYAGLYLSLGRSVST